jgi:archaetidylinositol phosphate synthase
MGIWACRNVGWIARSSTIPELKLKVEASPLAGLMAFFARRLAPRLPNWVTPNQLTLASLLAMLLAGLCFYLAGRAPGWFVPALLALYVHWLADDLDGALARARKLTSERGFFLDLYLDALGYTALFLGIAFASYTSFILPACYLLVIQLQELLLLHRILLRQEFVIPFPGPSELPPGLTLLSLLTVFRPGTLVRIGGLPVAWFDAAALLFGIVALAQLIFGTIRLATALEGVPP